MIVKERSIIIILSIITDDFRMKCVFNGDKFTLCQGVFIIVVCIYL